MHFEKQWPLDSSLLADKFIVKQSSSFGVKMAFALVRMKNGQVFDVSLRLSDLEQSPGYQN
jgi:hypothetical protein